MKSHWLSTAFLISILSGSFAHAHAQAPFGDATEITSNRTPEPPNEPTPASAPERPVATRQAAFAIPFSVDQSGLSGSLPVEVQLLVSSDQGKNWSLHLKERPDAKKFNFRAPGDGEYWFASRTIDAQNRSRPDGMLQPELKVIVDRQAPKFELTASATAEGGIKLVWNVFDANLSPESFKLEYRGATSQSWAPILVKPASEDRPRTTLVGEQTFVAHSTSRAVEIRGEVRDEAGNPAVAIQRVYVDRTTRRPDERPAGGLLSDLADLAKGPFQREETTTAPPDPFAARHRPAPIDTGAVETPSAGTAAPSKPEERSQPWLPSDFPVQAKPPGANASGSPGINASGSPGISATGSPIARSPFQPPVASRFASNSTERDPPPRAEPPLGEKPSFTSAKHFDLDYDTESVGPSGVAAVELWGTNNGGRTWTKWGLDADKRSPVRVDVEEDGLYGFRVVVESGIGLAGPRPHAGDTADIWVGVDSAKPNARLTSAIFGTGEFVGQLDIRWEASDENLTARPISLSFATDPAGPWTTIAAGLENNGRYLWNADPPLPRQIYLRLEARDEASNVGEQILADPISTEGLAPKGKIRGLRPVDSGLQGAAKSGVYR